MFAAALVLLALTGGGVPSVVAGDRRVEMLPSGSVMEIETFTGVPKWRLLPHLFSEKTVNVTCPSITDFSVYVSENPDKLVERVEQKRSAWCGFQSLLAWDSHTCVTRISPFRDTAVAVVHPPRHGNRACMFQEQEQFSAWQLGRGVLGTFLFLQADTLVNSIYFRLSTGTGGFVLLSFLILAFVIYRSVPNKKTMAASLALFGSTIMSAARYFVGSWFPSLEELMYNKWVGLYVVASALVGLAVTYYYDDPSNAKLNTILECGLQLGGLALVATSTSMPEASFTFAALLVVSRFYRHSLPRIPGAAFVQRQAQRLSSPGPAAVAPGDRRGSAATWPQPHQRRKQRRLVDLYNELHAAPLENGTPGGREEGEEPCSEEEDSEGESASSSQQTGASADGESAHQTPVAAPQGRRGRPSGRQLGTPQTPISPLVQNGMVYNEATGRTLQIGKPTYNKLVSQGYQMDEQRGVLTPPPSGRASGGRGSGGGGRSSGPSSGGGTRGSGGRKRQSLSAAAAMGLPS